MSKKIAINYFGRVAEVTNTRSETLSISGDKLEDVLEQIYRRYDLASVPINVALNHKLLKDTSTVTVNDGDEIGILPPFAGG